MAGKPVADVARETWVSLRLTPAEVQALAVLCLKMGVTSRSEAIRQAIRQALYQSAPARGTSKERQAA